MEDNTWGISKKNSTMMIPGTELEPVKIGILADSFAQDTALLKVTDRRSLEQTNEIIILGKNIVKAVGIVFDPLIAKARQPWDMYCAEKRNLLARIEPEIKRLDREAAIFLYEENKKRQKAEEERLELEAKKKILQEQTIQEIQSKGDLKPEEVNAVLDNAAAQESAIVEKMPVIEEKIKLDGQTKRDHWVAEVTDANLVPREYCSPDPKKLAEAARLFKDLATIPGVQIYNQPLMVKR